MNNKITITASDGRYFYGTLENYAALVGEVNAYEADLKLKKEKEEAERKIAEEKQKKLTQYRNVKLKEINETLQKAKDLIDEYEKTTGNKLIYDVGYCTGDISVIEVKNSIDYAWDNVIDEILKAFRSK